MLQKRFLASLAIAVAGVLGLAGSASAQCTLVSGEITVDTTWGSDVCLEEPIFVKSGATLTILPNVIVRGQPRTAAVTPGSKVGTPGALIVTATGRLVAAADAGTPIIMTTAAVDNDDNGVADDLDGDGFLDAWPGYDPATCPGTCDPDPTPEFLDDDPRNAPLAPLNKAGAANVSLWGGLVLLGNAPTNLDDGCGVGLGSCTVEGLTIPGFDIVDATYGGLFPHDSSGILDYVSVRYAGDEIGEGNELNGISMAGVGDGTVFRHIEVFANFDDGIEYFGGVVNADHLAIFFVGDDTFDLDQGYQGVQQFLFGIMPFFNENGGGAYGSASGDKGGEWDGDDFLEVGGVVTLSDGTCRPFSNPNMYNMTIMGSSPVAGADFTPVSPNGDKLGIQMRHGFAGELLNSIVVNTGTAQAFDVDTDTGEACIGYDSVDNVATCALSVLASTFENTAALPATELDALACGDNDPRTPAFVGVNCVNNAGFPGLINEDTTFDPTGNAAGKLDASLKSAPINPRVGPGFACVAGGVTPPPPLDGSATYRGAFDPSVPKLWTAGWTAMSRAGLLSD